MIQFIDALNSNLWLGFLLNVTMKSLVILAIAGVLAYLLRGKSAALRSLVWRMAIVGCLLVSLFFFTLSPLEIGILPGKPVGFETEMLMERNQPSVKSAPVAPHPLPTTAASSTRVAPPPIQPEPVTGESAPRQSNGSRTVFISLRWTDWLTLVWATGGLFLFTRLIVGVGTVWHISARSDDFSGSIQDVRLDLRPDWRRPVRIRCSDAVTVPMVWGLFRPTILLPADAKNWQEERLRAVLLHELAHIRRNDWESQLIAQITCAIYWFNPLVWFATRRMRLEAERACDDHVLNAGYQLTDYAQHLVEIVRTAKLAGSASRAAVAIARSSKIEERIRMILAENLNRRPMTKVAVIIGNCIVILFAGLIGTARLAEAVNQEDVLYQEIQSVSNSHPEPLAKDAAEADTDAWREGSLQNRERVITLCDKFLKAFPESERFDEIWYEKLILFRLLGRDSEFETGAAAFLSEFPSSKYADKLHKSRAYRLESQFKFQEALAEWDKIDDPAMLYEVYDRKGQIYSRMNNWEKRAEYDLLRAELILGKPAPEFSHSSVYGAPVSLSALRGKVVVLFHWSTRDGRTVRDDETGGEIIKLKHLYATYKDNPSFALICVCTQSSEEKLKNFVNDHAMPGTHLLLKHEEIPYQFGVNGWPYYVVLDKTGILRESAHAYQLDDLEIDRLVKALLGEDTSVPYERVIPQISKARADAYDFQDQEEKAVAKYEKLLAFMPDSPYLISELRYRNLKLLMEEMHHERKQSDTVTALMNQAYDLIVDASLSPVGPDASQALELATLFSKQDNREKTWKLFQIAVAHDHDNYRSAINYAKQKPERFAAIQEMPEFQKLLADAKQTEGEKLADEANRKQELYADEFAAAHKSFTAVEADNEIFTGIILTQVGHVLVPAIATQAEVIRVKIGDYRPATVLAADAASGLAVVRVDGQQSLRPVVLGNVDDLRDYALVPLPNPSDGYIYSNISVITARGYPNPPNLPSELPRDALGTPIKRDAAVMQLNIDDNGEVAELKVASPGRPSEIIRGDAIVFYDGRLLAVSLEKEVKYDNWGPSTDPIPIDQIRAALERMNIIQLMDGNIKEPAEKFE